MTSNGTKGHTCPFPMKATSNGVFQGDNPLDFALPLAILQICLVVVVTRGLALLLRPLRQPRVIAEIITSLTKRKGQFLDLGINRIVLPGVMRIPAEEYYLGIELDPKSLRQTGKKALSIAIAGVSLPFILGIGSSFVIRETIAKGVGGTSFLIFMGVALSITAFPVLARILAELKLLTTDVGRMAMSAAAVNDVAAWILLALAIALDVVYSEEFEPEALVESGVAHQKDNSVVKMGLEEAHRGWGFLDFSGVLVPKEGPFAGALVEKVEDLVSGLFLPLYFVSSGLKTNVATIQGLQSLGVLVLVIFTACFGKIVGTVVVSALYRVPFREALALGFLMNTKGLVELIVLNIGKDRKVLNDQTFAIMVVMALFTTFITTPLVMAVYKPAKRASKADYKHRTIERKNPNTQLRILACFLSSRNIPSVINLLEASRGVEKPERLCVYALHLMELSERSSAILMAHKARKKRRPFWNMGQRSNSNHVVVAFEAFQRLSQVSVRPMTSSSSLSDMHEDICTTAELKRTAFIILPFHKHQRLDGTLETTRSVFRYVNKRVLEHTPCSVGILVDHGLGGSTHVPASNVAYFITVLFFGGRDDREALAYGARMAEHPGIKLTVVHFSVEPESVGEIVRVYVDDNSITKLGSTDEEYLGEFKETISEDSSIKYEEKIVRNAVEAIAVVREFSRCSLFLVGRTPFTELALALNRNNSECPELGPVGSLLTSPDFSTTASVLVVQQYYNVESPNLTLKIAEELGNGVTGSS
ncbi:unnamed protein product [Camellia sinensis]